MKKLLFLFAVLLTSVGAWAQTETYYRLSAAATTLTSGKYVIQATSDKGVGPVYYNAGENGGRYYRYDLAVGPVREGAALKSKYVWDVELVADGEKVTIKFSDDNSKFFVKDAARNGNFSGTDCADLIPEEHTIGGVQYFALKLEEDATAANAVGYIHANSPGGNPNLSYWNSYADTSSCVKFQFYPVTLIKEDITKTYTYNFFNEAGNPLGTKSESAKEFYPDANSYLRAPSDLVVLTGAPSGLIVGDQTEFDIIVSYKPEFPFVPTTIASGNFADGTKWYNIKVRHGNDRKRLKAVADNLKEDVSWNDQDDLNQYFAFTGNPIDGFYLHNKQLGGSKVFSCPVTLETDDNIDGAFSTENGVAMELIKHNEYWQFAPVVRPKVNGRIHDLSGNLCYWHADGANGDAGSDFTIFCVDVDADKVNANFIFKEGTKELYRKSIEYYAGYDIVLLDASKHDAVRLDANYDYMPAVGGDIEVSWSSVAPFKYSHDNSSINYWYYIQLHSNNKKYIQFTSNDSPLEWTDSEMDLGKLDTYSWAFVGNPFDGFKLLNRATGFTMGLVSTGSGDPKIGTYEDATKFVYAKSTTNTQGGFCLKYPGSTNYLNGQDSKVAHHGAADAGSTMLVWDAIPVALTTDDNNPIYYKIRSGRGADKWFIYDSEKIKLDALTATDNDYWYFKGTFNTDKKLLVQLCPKAGEGRVMSYADTNDGRDKIIAKSSGESGYTNTWIFASTNGSAPYGMKPASGNTFLSHNGGFALTKYMGFYNSQTDDGSKIYFSIDPTFVQEYTKTGEFWGSPVATYPSGLNNTRECAGGKGNASAHIGVNGNSVYMASIPVEGKNICPTVLFQWKNDSGNSHGISILGVDLIDSDGNVVGYDYHYGFSGGSSFSNTYYLPRVASGTYMLRYYVCNLSGDHSLTATGGSITVEGLAQSTDDQFAAYFNSLKSVAQNKRAWAVDDKKGTYGYYTEESSVLLNNAYNTAVEAASPTITIANRLIDALHSLEMVVPQTERFYRIKGKASGLYITGAWQGNTISAGNKFKLAAKTGEHTDATIFYLTADNKLRNYRTGTYLKETYHVGAAGDSGNTISFNLSESDNPGYFTLKTNAGSPYMYDDLAQLELDRNGSYAANHCEWEIEDVTSLPVVVPLSGVTSLYTPCAVAIPEGVTVKYVKTEGNTNTTGTLAYTELEDIIPANTAVIVEGVAGIYDFNLTVASVPAVEGNILFGYEHKTVVANSNHAANVFQITEKNNSVGFYLNEQAEYQAYKAYLDITSLSAQSGVEFFGVIDYANYFTLETQVVDWESNNPNTHLGTITLTNGEVASAKKMAASESAKYYYRPDNSQSITLELTRKYRGYEFLGFWLGEEELGTTPTLTAEQANSVTEANPIIAMYKPTDEVTLFYDDDEFSYRIPAITTTGTGRIFAVSDYRHNLDDIGRDKHGTGTMRIDLVARYSDNNGETWSETMTIAAGDDSKTGSYLRAFGDAAIAAVGENIVVMAAAGDQLYHYATTASPNRMVRIFSSDNGMTWSKEEMTTKMYNSQTSLVPNGVAAFFGSGKLVVDANFNGTEKARIYGALLVRTYINEQYNNNNNYVVYSDDLGVTWSILGGSQTPVASGDEPKVEILPSGQILLSARRGGGRKFNVFTYTNKETGAGTWSTAVNGCDNGGSNGTNGEIFLIDAKNVNGDDVKLLLQSQPAGGGNEWDRRDVSIWYKEISSAADHNHTPTEIANGWTKGMQVSQQLSAYSSMSLQKDGKIAFFFEEAPCYDDNHEKGYSMVYVPLTIDEITKGRYLASNTNFEAEKSISVTLTDAEGNVYKDDLTASLAGIGTALTTKYPFITLGNNVGINLVDESYTYTNTVTLPFKVSNENGTYWHNIYIPTYDYNSVRRPVYFYSESKESSTVKIKKEGADYGASIYNTKLHADNMSWAIYSVNNGFAFTFKNKLTDKFIKVTTSAPGSKENVYFDVKANATAFSLEKNTNYRGDYIIKNGDAYLSVCSSSDVYLTFYNGNYHWGSTAKIVEAPDFDALITEANDVLSWIGEGLGKYTVSESNTAIAETAKTEMQTPNTVKLNDLNTYKNLLEGATLNRPESGQFYRISYDFGNAGVKYLQGVASSVNKANQITPPVSYDGEKGAASIFYYSGSKLLSYTAGTYLREQDNYRGLQGVGVDGGNVTFGESSRAKGKYTIQIPSYLHANTTNSAHHSDHCSGDGDHTAHDHSIEEVTSLPFTFKKTALGFATFNAPVAVEIPAGVLAYVAEVIENENKLQMFRLEGNMIPAETPVLLYNESAKTANQNVDIKIVDSYAGNEGGDISTKKGFYGTVAAETYPENTTVYSLQKHANDEKVGFYQKANTTTLAGFKAWVKIAGANSARAFTIIFDGDDATGLKEALGIENENVEIYDLSGRRLDKPTKGINVVGGKLVIN